MRVSSLIPTLGFLLCSGGVLVAQQSTLASPSMTGVATPVTAGEGLTADSGYPGPRLGLGVGPTEWQGPDAVPPTPAGMIGRSTPGIPSLMYFALQHRTGTGIAPGDAQIIDSRQADLVKAAQFRGYNLVQGGWMYQQAICPATQPASGSGTAESSEGSILLHFVRHEDTRVWAFTAVVPRDPALPVRAIGIAHNSVEQHQDFLSAATTEPVVNRAIAPAALYQRLQPLNDWIATGACIAEMGGAYPHIPSAPSLSTDIVTAPDPYLVLGLHGERELRFTDRVNDAYYVVWDEKVSARGKMDGAHREQHAVRPPRIEHPREPKSRRMADGAEPRVKIRPYPSSPIDGN